MNWLLDKFAGIFFSERKATIFMGCMLLIYLAMVSTVVYVAVHFIRKFW